MQYTPGFDNIGDIHSWYGGKAFWVHFKALQRVKRIFDYNFIFSYVLHKCVLRTNRAYVIHTPPAVHDGLYLS